MSYFGRCKRIPNGGNTNDVLKKASGDDFDITWGTASAGVSAWGDITGTLANQTDLQGALDGKETVGAVTTHVAAPDPHTQYLTTSEGNAAYDAINAASTAITNHEAASNPHPTYLTEAEADALYDAAGDAVAAVTAHEAASDPHPTYLTATEGNAAYSAIGHSHNGLAPSGGTTSQVLKKNSNTNYDYSWATDETGGTASWGGISGTLSNQTDLQSALDGKSATSHNHDASYSALGHNHDASYAALAHSHAASDVTSGTIATARLGSGTANSTTYLRGDQTWATPAGATVVGYVLNGAAANQSTTTDSQTMYWASLPSLAPTTTAGNTRMYIPKAGTVKVIYVFVHAATAGSAENWSMNFRLNNTTDTLIQTLASSSAQRVWSNTGLSVAVSQGDYFEIKEVQPAWGTNPANVRRSVVVYIE